MNNAEIQVDSIGPKQSPIGKRKSESSGGSPVQITRPRSELGKNMGERTKLGVPSNGIKKSPAQIKKTRSLTSPKAVGDQTSVKNEICSVQLRKVKSDSAKALYDSKRELRRKVINEDMKEFDDKKVVDESIRGTEESPTGIKQSRSNEDCKELKAVINEDMKEFDDKKVVDESIRETEESPNGIKKARSNQDCKELKAITNNVSNEVEIQIETAPPSDEQHKEIEADAEKKDLESINIVSEEEKPKKLVIKEKKLLPRNERSAPTANNHTKIHPKPASDNFHGPPSKLQSFADLIMWRDVSRSAFVFGIGAFSIISSSYAKDLNISFISVLSYLALVYLGVSFIFRSTVRRSNDTDKRDEEYVVGEEEAVWILKLILPYVNEFLSKLRRLFSGDPGTTMKLAVLLFILARYGGSITIWKMAKLGFFGVFVVPKLCSSYSSHLAAYGTFWIRRFGDAWQTCSNKKAVGFGIFALVWNLSSVVARIWAVFILFVAFKYYQQCCLKEEECVQEE